MSARPLPDPYKPSDWKAPELITVPKVRSTIYWTEYVYFADLFYLIYWQKEQKTEIPMYRNDISCCGAKGDNYLTGPTSAIHSLKPMPGIMQTDRVTGKTYMGPKNKTGPNPKCRPCSPRYFPPFLFDSYIHTLESESRSETFFFFAANRRHTISLKRLLRRNSRRKLLCLRNPRPQQISLTARMERTTKCFSPHPKFLRMEPRRYMCI